MDCPALLGQSPAMLAHVAARRRTTPAGNLVIFLLTQKKADCFHNLPNHAFVTIFIEIKMAPALGFEPRTKWLTATYSTAELCRSENTFQVCVKTATTGNI